MTDYWIAKHFSQNKWMNECSVFADRYKFDKWHSILMTAIISIHFVYSNKKSFQDHDVSSSAAAAIYVTHKHVLVLVSVYYIQYIHQRVYCPEDNPNSL